MVRDSVLGTMMNVLRKVLSFLLKMLNFAAEGRGWARFGCDFLAIFLLF